jgi:type II secretory pathway pseudopilin PulG
MFPPVPSTHGRKARGFTAIEALFASVLLAILTAAVSGALMAGRQQTKLARDTLNASFLGQSLMDEIMRLPFSDPSGYTTMGPDVNETSRALYNNVDDYSGYTDGPSNLADIAGQAYSTTYQAFKRTVTMSAVSTSPSGWNRTVTGLLVTVSVTREGVEVIRLQRVAWN